MTMLIHETAHFTLEHADFCALPGYLILRLKGPERALADLSAEAAAELGGLLSRAATALEQVTGAERVYVLSFCEVDRRLHFHLLPRTAGLREAWAATTGKDPARPVDGPAIFEWCRATFRADSDLPAGWPSVQNVVDALSSEFSGSR